MRKINALLLAGLLATPLYGSNSIEAESILGDPPRAPESVAGLPSGEPQLLDVTSGFSVDTSSREQAREFYNAIYNSSEDTPINSTANVSNCFAGTNSTEFSESTLRRINWFRAMAGIPAAVTFDAAESAKDQQAAVIMASNGKLQHVEFGQAGLASHRMEPMPRAIRISTSAMTGRRPSRLTFRTLAPIILKWGTADGYFIPRPK